MSKKIYLFSLVLLALAFTACSETETVDKYDNWRSRNESFIDSLANVFEAGTDPLLLRIKVEQGNDYIYYKTKTPITVNSVHTEVLGEKPTSTAVVKAFYREVMLTLSAIMLFSSEIATRSCCMVSRLRNVTQLSSNV